MPTQPIPFGVRQESGLSELGGGAPAIMNVVVDGRGVVRRRPGIAAYSAAPSGVVDADGIQALYVPATGDLYAVGGSAGGRKIYRVLPGGAVDISFVGGGLGGDRRPVFAETEAMLAIAGGAAMKELIFGDPWTVNLGGSSPKASHVIANASRLLANSIDVFKNQLFFSDQAAGSSTTGNEQWASGTAGYVSADARPDPLVAVHENSNEVYAFGATCVQVFVQDPQLVYASATTRENGLSAPYSVVKVDQEFAWLDHLKRFVLGSGRGVEVISGPIQSSLDALSAVSDCYGYRVQLGVCEGIAWAFPSAGVTYVYNKDFGWGQWSGWDSTYDRWKQFPVLSCFQRPDTGACVVGLTDGRIAEIRESATTDLGEEIKASATTGFIDRDTSKLKCTTALRLTLKRGARTGDGAPVALLSYRDDMGSYCSPLAVDLGATGDRYTVVEYRSLGTYRTRQWRFEFLGSDDFELVSAEEDFTIQGV